MSSSNPISISSDSPISNSFWDEEAWNYILNNPGKTKKEVFEAVSSRKRTHADANSNLVAAGPSSIHPNPQEAVIIEDSSDSNASYISPCASTNNDTESRILDVIPLARMLPSGEMQIPPFPPLLTTPPQEEPSASSPPVREVVRELACPRVYEWIDMRGAPKVMPKWGFPKKP